MKKFMIMIAGLLNISSAVAMDIMKLGNKEKHYFEQHLLATVAFGKQMIQEKKITEKNALHVIHCNLLDKLTEHKGDLFTIVLNDDDLRKDVNYYAEVIESDEYMSSLRLKVVKGSNDDPETINAKKELMQLRREYAQDFVKYDQSEYVVTYAIDDNEETIKFMMNNENYPLDQEAQKNISFHLFIKTY